MHYDVLTAKEAAILLEIEFRRHGTRISGWDVLNDAQHGRRGRPFIPVAKHRGKRYFRRRDVEALAAALVHTGRKTKPPKRPTEAELMFSEIDPSLFIRLTM